MERKSPNSRNLLEACKQALPDYFKSLKTKGFTIQDIKLTKDTILALFNEDFMQGGSKFKRMGFNIKSIMDPSKFPELFEAGLTSKDIKLIVMDFLNYLSLNKMLDRRNTISIQRWMEEQEKTRTVTLKTEGNEKRMGEIQHKVIEIVQNIEDIWDDDEEYLKMLHWFDNVPTVTLINVILQLFQTLDDDSFQRLLFFIDQCLKIDDFPSHLLELLRDHKDQQDRFFFRMLMLYQTFFMAGYILNISFDQVISELEVDVDEFSRYAIGIISQYDLGISGELESINDVENLEQEIKNELNLQELIDNITPIHKSDPYSHEISERAFNFPEDINIGFRDYVQKLLFRLGAFNNKIKFLHSDWDGWMEKIKDQRLLQKLDIINKHYYNGKYRQALRIIKETSKMYPENAYIPFLKGKVLQALGSIYNAFKSILKSLKLDSRRIDTFIELAALFEIGGYFYHSCILTTYLLHFTPFNINLLIQLAFSKYQLSLPFKKTLELAGRLDPARLANFLTKYWFHERIVPRDSLSSFGMTKEDFSQFLEYSDETISKATELVEIVNINSFNNAYLEDLNKYIGNICNFFPNKEDHIAKNQAVYELGREILAKINFIFFEHKSVLPYLVASKQFIDFSMLLSRVTIDEMLTTSKQRGKTTSLEIDTEIILTNKDVISHPIYELVRYFISEEGISRFLIQSTIDFIEECQTCPVKCLEKPFKWSASFYIFNVPGELNDHAFLVNFIDSLNDDFFYWLEDKALKSETISKKVEHVEYFLTHLINIIKEGDKEIIEEVFANYLKAEILDGFLSNVVIPKRLVESKTALNHLLNSLKSFIRFYFEGDQLYYEVKRDSIEFLKHYKVDETIFR